MLNNLESQISEANALKASGRAIAEYYFEQEAQNIVWRGYQYSHDFWYLMEKYDIDVSKNIIKKSVLTIAPHFVLSRYKRVPLAFIFNLEKHAKYYDSLRNYKLYTNREDTLQSVLFLVSKIFSNDDALKKTHMIAESVRFGSCDNLKNYEQDLEFARKLTLLLP